MAQHLLSSSVIDTFQLKTSTLTDDFDSMGVLKQPGLFSSALHLLDILCNSVYFKKAFFVDSDSNSINYFKCEVMY